eukprot:TRINITY_DN18992_c0_g1_i1.p2 TRINITY_DN18992_c0_g1~~TRINITY_DN18992_c0_g1_i1.p2  ORF type:complete len:250 (+),score=91.32 TRINITY_DN18992_c0_g1_i1:81-752(+)
MLRRTCARRYWFYDQWRKELTEQLHIKAPEVSEAYTHTSQAMARVTRDTPDEELTDFERALKRSITPISDALPVPRSIDPCYLSVNGEPVPQTYKFLPNRKYYEHLCNCKLRWALHPFEKLVSPHPSGYMEPLGPVPGNEDMPYTTTRTPIGKLPITLNFRAGYTSQAINILSISGDKHAFGEDLRMIFPNKRVLLRQDRIEMFKASYDCARVIQHYLFAVGM